MLIPTIISAANKLVVETSTPTFSEQDIIIRFFRSTNKVLKDLFGSEIYAIGAGIIFDYNYGLIMLQCYANM